MGAARFEALFDAVPEAVVLVEFVDGDPVVRNTNETFRDRFGYETATIAGDSLNDYIVPDGADHQSAAAAIDATAAEGEPVEREVTRLTADGRREFLFRAVPFEETGSVMSVGIYVDITDRRRERQRYETLIRQSSDIITVLETDGTIRYESPSVERVLGYDQGALIGESAFDYIHPDDRAEVVEAFEAAVADSEATPRIEYRFRAADGEWRVLESVGSNHVDDPPVEGYVVNSRDVTERKQREQQLEWYRAYVEYQRKKRALSDLRVEMNVLETEQSAVELRDDERYQRLQSRAEELAAELEAIEAEHETIPQDEEAAY